MDNAFIVDVAIKVDTVISGIKQINRGIWIDSFNYVGQIENQ